MVKALPVGRALSALLLPVSFPPLFQLPCCAAAPSGTCQLHGPFSHHFSQAYITWALVYDTECGCWVFPHSPWHSGPSHPPSVCLGTPCWVALSPTHTSFPINTRPGSQPLQPLGQGGREAALDLAKGLQAMSFETEPVAFLTELLRTPNFRVCIFFSV